MMHFKKCLGVFIFLVLLCTISNLTMAQEELKSIIILTLGEIADSSTTSLIYNQLRDKDIFVRMAALRALGKINDQSLLPKLRLIQERNKLVSIYLTALLTRLGDEEARTKIKGYLKSDNIQLKTGALSVIRIFDISNVLLEVQVGSKPIMDKIDPIINTIISYLNDKNPDIRKKAIELLLSIDKAKTEENFKIILPHLNLNDESLEVRRMALLYISYLDIEEYYGKMSRKDAIFFLKELRNRLYEEDKYIRSFAKIILAKIKDGNSIKIIKNDLLNPGTFLHASSVYALACAKDFEAIPILANDFLDNRFSIVDRQYLIYALKVIQSYSYSDIVKIPKRIRCYTSYLLKNKNIIVTLLINKSTPVKEYFINAIADSSSPQHEFAAEVLGLLGDREVTPYLVNAIRGKDYNVQLQAIKALGQLRDKSAVPALVGFFEEKFLFKKPKFLNLFDNLE